MSNTTSLKNMVMTFTAPNVLPSLYSTVLCSIYGLDPVVIASWWKLDIAPHKNNTKHLNHLTDSALAVITVLSDLKSVPAKP